MVNFQMNKKLFALLLGTFFFVGAFVFISPIGNFIANINAGSLRNPSFELNDYIMILNNTTINVSNNWTVIDTHASATGSGLIIEYSNIWSADASRSFRIHGVPQTDGNVEVIQTLVLPTSSNQMKFHIDLNLVKYSSVQGVYISICPKEQVVGTVTGDDFCIYYPDLLGGDPSNGVPITRPGVYPIDVSIPSNFNGQLVKIALHSGYSQSKDMDLFWDNAKVQ